MNLSFYVGTEQAEVFDADLDSGMRSEWDIRYGVVILARQNAFDSAEPRRNHSPRRKLDRYPHTSDMLLIRGFLTAVIRNVSFKG
jgi:hypothetical protein